MLGDLGGVILLGTLNPKPLNRRGLSLLSRFNEDRHCYDSMRPANHPLSEDAPGAV